MRGLAIVLPGAAVAALLLARAPEPPARRTVAPQLHAPAPSRVRAAPAPGRPASPAPSKEDERPVPGPMSPRPVSVVRGVFVDEAGVGLPGVRIVLAFARVRSCYTFHLGRRDVTTDAAGRYAVLAPRRASWYTTACEPPPDFARPANRRIGAPWRAEARFVLVRAAHVTGRVERADGTPVHGAELRAEWIGSRAFDCRTRSDDGGFFRLDVPKDVRGFTVVARGFTSGEFNPFANRTEGDRGDRSLATVRVPGVDPGSDLRIVLPLAIAAELRFVDPNGEPLDRGCVKIHEERGNACVSKFYCGESACRVTSLAPARYRFEYHPQDQDLAPASVSAVLPSAEPIELRCGRGARVTGALLGTDTKGFRVTWLGRANRYDTAWGLPPLAEWDGQAEPAAEVVDGRFELLGLAPRTAALYVHKPGDPRCAYVPDVRAGTESLALHLEPGYSIRGAVVGFDPARRYKVRAVRGAISVLAKVAADGAFAIVGLPPGRFRVEVLARERTKTLVVGATADVEAGAERVRVRAR